MNLSKEQLRVLSYLKNLQLHGQTHSLTAQWLSTASRMSKHKLIAVRDALLDMGLINVKKVSRGYVYEVLT